MATKIHVGFRDGKLTSGKCEADKGKCPYGNHFASQSESDAYKEHVAGIFCTALSTVTWRLALKQWARLVTV